MSSDEKDDDEKVGYCSPPKNGQFKKGQSGNPKGRPPKKLFHEIVVDVLNEEVAVTKGIEKVYIMKKEVFFQQLVQDAMKGDDKAVKNLLWLMRQLHNMALV